MIALGSAHQSCLIKFWDIAEGKVSNEIKGHPSITELALVPDGTSLISAGEDRVIRVWDIASWRVVRQFSVECRYSSIAVSPVMTEPIAAVVDGKAKTDVLIWNYRTGEHLRTFKGQIFSVGTMKFSPDGKMLLTNSGLYVATGDPDHSTPPLSANEPSFRVWDVQAGRVLCSGSKDCGECRGLAFSPSGEFFCTSDTDSYAIQLWKSPKPIGEK
jgi:WD40 repeat protein